MHCPSVEAGKMSKTLIVIMLSDETKKTSFVRCASRTIRIFRILNSTLSSTLSTFLDGAQNRCLAVG